MLRLRTLGGLDLSDAAGQPHSLLSQPKRLGLLVYLATANGHGYRRRDNILPLFWPELDDVRARGALRQAMYVLRHELGDGVIRTRGDDELGIDPSALWFDVVAFDAALAAGDQRAAADLYRGDFLEGFYVAGSGPEFDEWVAAERRRLRSLASRAMWAVAADASLSDASERPIWIRRAVALAPDDEVAVRQALVRLAQIGDRAGAMQLYYEFRERLHREYNAQPATETKAIAEALRSSQEPTPSPAPISTDGVETPSSAPASRGTNRATAPRGDTAPPSRWRVSRRAWAGGVLAIAALASAWTFYYKIGDTRSPNGSPVYGVLIADITAPASDSLAARAVTELLRKWLALSRRISLVSRADIDQTLQRMELPPVTRLNDSVARVVAKRGGYESILTASLTPMGGGFVLSARLTALSGPELAAASETVTSADALIPAVDRLARTLRSRIGESHQTIGASPWLERVTTRSMRALELFTQAQDESRALGSQPPRTVALLYQALAVDSTFSMAHRRLGLALFNLGRTREAMAEVRAAARFSDGLTEIERLTALASLHGLLREHNHAINEITEILRLDPSEVWARTNLMYQLQIAGQYDRAEQELRARGPIPGNRNNLVWSNIHEFQGRGAAALDSARANYRRYRDSTGSRVLRNARIQMANFSAVRLAYDSALFYAMPVGPADQGSPIYVAVSQFARGQLTDAIATQRRRALKADGEQPEDSPRTATESFTALATMLIKGDRAAASRLLDGVLADTGYRNRDPANRHIRPIIALAAVGRAADARHELASLEMAANQDVLTARETSIEIANGAVSLAEHRPREAIVVLTRAATTIDWGSFDACRVCALPWLGRAYEAVGRPDSAAMMYERFLSTGDPFRLFADATWRPALLRRLGVLHAQSGDTARAVQRLSEFIDLWKGADAELQPEVEKARRRVIELLAPRGLN